ncbi:hypothetical protein ACHAWX_000685 [Stephanocyclus meneghinianus]
MMADCWVLHLAEKMAAKMARCLVVMMGSQMAWCWVEMKADYLAGMRVDCLALNSAEKTGDC